MTVSELDHTPCVTDALLHHSCASVSRNVKTNTTWCVACTVEIDILTVTYTVFVLQTTILTVVSAVA